MLIQKQFKKQNFLDKQKKDYDNKNAKDAGNDQSMFALKISEETKKQDWNVLKDV